MKVKGDTQLEEKAIYEKMAGKTVESFLRMGINAQYVPTKEAAFDVILDMIPEGTTVGTADSATVVQVGVFPALSKRNRNVILNPFIRDETGHFIVSEEERLELMRKVLLCDVYVIGTNAVTLDGKLVNADARGHRVAAMLWGPRKVIIVVGVNKIVKNLDVAFRRLREICGPMNAYRHATKHYREDFLNLPCVRTGICVECSHEWRICQSITIIEGVWKADRGRINVVLVGEKLGL